MKSKSVWETLVKYIAKKNLKLPVAILPKGG